MDVKEYNKKWHHLINDSFVFLGTLEQNIQKSDTPEEVLKTFKLVGWSTELKEFLEKAVSVYQKILVRQTQIKSDVAEEKRPQVYEMAYLMCEMERKPKTCKECPGSKGGCFSIPKAEALYDAGFRKEEEENPEMPICGDCLCRVCANSNCLGCEDCQGVVETEDDCVQEFVSYGDD